MPRCWGVLLSNTSSSSRGAAAHRVAGEYSPATLAAAARLQSFEALLGSTREQYRQQWPGCNRSLHCWGVLLGNISSNGKTAVAHCLAGEYSSATLTATARRAVGAKYHGQPLVHLGGVGWDVLLGFAARSANTVALRQAHGVQLLSEAHAFCEPPQVLPNAADSSPDIVAGRCGTRRNFEPPRRALYNKSSHTSWRLLARHAACFARSCQAIREWEPCFH